MPRNARSLEEKALRRSDEPPHGQASDLSEVFHENTKLGPVTGAIQAASIQRFLTPKNTQALITRAYKSYSLRDRVELPAVEPRSELQRACLDRRSVRTYGPEPLDLEALGRILYLTSGRTGPEQFFRPVASAGALYPLEVYLVPKNVTGLEPGVYHYDTEAHGLDVVSRQDRWARVLEEIVLGGIDLESLGAFLFVTAVFRRNTCKYGDRGYRLVLMEAGAVAHNLSLLAPPEGIGLCQLGAFHDDRLSALLEIDGVEEAPLLALAVGSLPPAADEESEG